MPKKPSTYQKLYICPRHDLVQHDMIFTLVYIITEVLFFEG